ncbi:MAG: nitrous oxide reductase accessory protein NosL [Rhodospirillales bacterium]|nr:nitrous oxide reductase accessory protein NosL [Rhodospirillales bacterium]
MRRGLLPVAVLAAVLLAACGEDERAEAPPPEKISYDSIGHYCGMAVMEHKGPKGQILLKSQDRALWFTSVRDTIAYTMLLDEAKDYDAIYVTDMGRATDWDHPENGAWVEARDAFYVIGSTKVGGMGAPETVPFGSRQAAEAFTREHGGTIFAFKDIPQDAVLGAVEMKSSTGAPPVKNGAHAP